MNALPRILPALCGALVASLFAAWGAGQLMGGPAAPPEPVRQVLEERFPDGGLHVRREVLQTPAGQSLNDGRLTVWYASGQMRSQGVWQSGQKHGPFEHWHENGALAKRVHYDGGLADGPYTEWDERGRVVRQETWRHGRRVDAVASP